MGRNSEDGNVALSVSQSTVLTQTEISKQLHWISTSWSGEVCVLPQMNKL